MSDDEKMRFFSNSAHYPKDVADLLSIPAAERKKALKKIGRFMQAATKGRNWAKKEIPAWENASLCSWCSVIDDVGYPLCLWTAGSIVRRFQLCDRKIISMPDKWEYPWYAAWDLHFRRLRLLW